MKEKHVKSPTALFQGAREHGDKGVGGQEALRPQLTRDASRLSWLGGRKRTGVETAHRTEALGPGPRGQLLGAGSSHRSGLAQSMGPSDSLTLPERL